MFNSILSYLLQKLKIYEKQLKLLYFSSYTFLSYELKKMMLHISYLFLLIFMTFNMHVQSLAKKIRANQDTDDPSDEWSEMKWDSFSKDFVNIDMNKASTEDPNQLNVLFSLPNEPKLKEPQTSKKLSESELENLSKDEVFMNEFRKRSDGLHRSSPDEPTENENLSDKLENIEHPLNFKTDDMSEISRKSSPNSSLKQGNSDKVSLDVDQSNEISEESDFNVLGERSFIFNPMATPQEKFQNCTTPKNETGSCKYLQHCLIPTIVSSLGQFMDYVCIIEGRFIGVCCPSLPASVVIVQEQEEVKGETELNENCGVATNTRIVGGANADPKAWPWMVALLAKSKKKFFCGGSLINDVYVLTAAHCTFGVPKNEIIARVGEYDFRHDEGNHEEYSVVEIKRHGHYNRRNLRNDIALLKLEKPVKFNNFIQTICFPEGEKDYVGEKATLTGWGNLAGGGATSEILQQTTLPIISSEECAKGHGLPIPESLICTASKVGDTGACNGDSGGPLMLLDSNNRWKVIGLVSWGRRGCDPEFPTVYTRVSFFLDWIKKHAT